MCKKGVDCHAWKKLNSSSLKWKSRNFESHDGAVLTFENLRFRIECIWCVKAWTSCANCRPDKWWLLNFFFSSLKTENFVHQFWLVDLHCANTWWSSSDELRTFNYNRKRWKNVWMQIYSFNWMLTMTLHSPFFSMANFLLFNIVNSLTRRTRKWRGGNENSRSNASVELMSKSKRYARQMLRLRRIWGLKSVLDRHLHLIIQLTMKTIEIHSDNFCMIWESHTLRISEEKNRKINKFVDTRSC